MGQHWYFDAVVIGGGTTGTAVLRDLTMRGLTNVLLVEKEDLAAGTSGRCHSNLHGGGRYVVNDIEAARECVHENRVLRHIAPHTIDPTNGLFIAINEEGVEFTKQWMKNAQEIGMWYRELDPEEVMREEPLISRNVLVALETHDAGFDPFRMSTSQAVDACRRGATVWVHHESIQVVVEGGRVTGLIVRNNLTGEIKRVYTNVVVNAAGPWSGKVCASAGIDIPMKPDKGTMVVYNFRLARPMVHILRLPTDGDGLVSMGYQNTTILGTTSGEIVDPDEARPTLAEVERMEEMVQGAFPWIKRAKRLRYFCGVRPLCEAGPATGREISRRLILIDHKEVHGVEGFVTITGGKYATSRLMAEVAVDRVCKWLGITKPCRTHLEPLPGAETARKVDEGGERLARSYYLPFYTTHKLTARYGAEAAGILERYPEFNYVICQCGQILASEVVHAISEEWAATLDDIRRRARIGMGTCQGTFCTLKVASLVYKVANLPISKTWQLISDFLAERWRGVWMTGREGDMAAQAALNQAYYGCAGNVVHSMKLLTGEGVGQ